MAQALGRTLRPGDEIVVTEMEHHSNLIPWQMACRDRGAVLRAVPVMDGVHLDMDAFERLLGAAHARGGVGARVERARHDQPRGGDDARGPTPRARSCSSTAPRRSRTCRSTWTALGADFYVFSGHKMLGPTGIGVLYGRREVLERLEPAWGGGEMIKEVWIDRAQWNDLPWRFEPGTPPIAAAVGPARRRRVPRQARHGARGRLRAGDHRSAASTRSRRIAGVTVYGPRNAEIKGAVVAFNVEGIHPTTGPRSSTSGASRSAPGITARSRS